MIGGIGDAVRQQIKEYLGSREAAEEVQRVVGADRRLAQVRNGQFAEEGVIGQQYLPMGAGVNLLPARAAEYEAFEVGESLNTSVSAQVEDGTIVTQNGVKRLRLSADATAIASTTATHDPYIDPWTTSRWFNYAVDGLTYIYSTHIYRVSGAVNNNMYVGIRVQAADDVNGTNMVNVINQVTQEEMTRVTGTAGTPHRVHAKFVIPAGKTYLRISLHILNAAGAYVNVGNAMLENITDYRSYPSKYTGPVPRQGEMSPEQLSFGAGSNILPYDKATFAASAWDLSTIVNGSTTGDVNINELGSGYNWTFVSSFTSNTWWAPYENYATSAYRLERNKYYIASAYIKNTGPHTETVYIRVGTADTTADIAARTGTWEVKATSGAVTIPSGERKRVYVKWQHDANAANTNDAMGPRIEFKANNPADDVDYYIAVDSVMVEEVGITDLYPSKYTLPAIGNNKLQYSQVEITPAISYSKAAAQTIANGATNNVAFVAGDRDYWQNWPVSDGAPNIETPFSGLYLITGSVKFAANTSGNNRVYLYIRHIDDLTNIDYMVGSVMLPAITGVNVVSGSRVLRLNAVPAGAFSSETSDRVVLRVQNSFATGSVDITDANITMTYIGQW